MSLHMSDSSAACKRKLFEVTPDDCWLGYILFCIAGCAFVLMIAGGLGVL